MNIFNFIKSKLTILEVTNEYATLKRAGSDWKGSCPFFLEDPYIDVPGMCYHIYSDYMLDRVK